MDLGFQGSQGRAGQLGLRHKVVVLRIAQLIQKGHIRQQQIRLSRKLVLDMIEINNGHIQLCVSAVNIFSRIIGAFGPENHVGRSQHHRLLQAAVLQQEGHAPHIILAVLRVHRIIRGAEAEVEP
ncbi:hypothetical protein D3C76_1396490 [compost metagenome]